jgi:1-acyl-sn-glycerol-3-phosphate acyltransferase
MTAGALARLISRAIPFVLLLAYAGWRYLRDVRSVPTAQSRAARARWLQGVCQRQLRLQNVRIAVHGRLPQSGLIVANHLSYMDIIALCATLPCVFVSKKEIADWPLFGIFARLSGTLFLDRQRRRAIGGIAAQMREVLAAGLPLVFFPEATSTHGDVLLPFKTSLFEPVAELGWPVTAAALSYEMSDGSVRDEVHWWGTMTLTPHLLNLLGKRSLEVTIRFGEPRKRTGDRKTIAREMHAEVSALLGGNSSSHLD